MDTVLRFVVAIAYGYLMGSMPTAYLVARWRRGIDIRRYGSGNVGASNVARHVGKTDFVVVATFDILVKGVGSALLARGLGLDLHYQVLAVLAAVMGHNWSAYLRFSGGRGLSVVAGGLLVLAWKELVALAAVGLLGWWIFKSVALWFGISLALLPLWAILLGEPPAIVVLCAAVLVATAFKRLLSNPGTASPGLRWRDVAITRLLYDRDTPDGDQWVMRKPRAGKGEGGR